MNPSPDPTWNSCRGDAAVLPIAPGAGSLERLLFDTDVHPARYVLRAWPMATLPTFAIAVLLAVGAERLGAGRLFDEGQWDGLKELPRGLLMLQVLLAAPLLETLLMAPILALLTRLLPRRRWVVLASALLWAGLHSLSVPVWGLCIFWTFAVFSSAFLAWRPRSFWHAYFVTAAVHALNNAVAGLGLLLT